MKSKIVKNYVFNLLYQMLVLFVPLVTAPYLARVLGPEGNGAYGYVYSLTSVVSTVVLLGIFNYGNRQVAYVRDDKDKLSDMFWRIMSARIVIAIFGTTVYYLIVIITNRYISLFALYYTHLFASFLDPTWLYVGVEDMKWAVIKNTVTKVLAVVGIFAFVKSEKDLPIYVLIQGGSVLISNLLSYSQLPRYVSKPHFDFKHIWEDLRGAIVLFLPSIATTIYTQCDKVMIELLSDSSSEVAFYDYSEKIVLIPLSFITVLSTVMMPRIANEFHKGNLTKIEALLNRAAQFSMFIAFPMTFGLMAVADKLVPWYLGNEYLPTISAIILISPIVISNTLIGISGGQYFTATNQMKILILSQFFAAGANIIINYLLIPSHGFRGAAIATLLTSFSCSIVQYSYLLRQVKLSGLLKKVCKYGLFAAVMFVVIRLITSSFTPSVMTNAIQVVLGIAVYMSLCFFSHDEFLVLVIEKVISKLKETTNQ